ncbi:MAG: hypothetical protein AAF388_27565 [Bacteroidota bacterium]
MKNLQKIFSFWLIAVLFLPATVFSQTHYPVSILPIPDFHVKALKGTYQKIEKISYQKGQIRIAFWGTENVYEMVKYRVKGLMVDEFPTMTVKTIHLNKETKEADLPTIDLFVWQVQNFKQEKKRLKAWSKKQGAEQLILYFPENTSIADLNAKSRKKAMAFSKKVNFGFLDVPPNWNKYVDEHGLIQEEMFRRGKINDHGEYVIAGIIYQYLMLPF